MDRIKLGLMAPFSGMLSPYGEEIARAARIACEEVNARGGVLGESLELVVLDDGTLSDSAVKAARSLIDDHHCAALVGNLLSSTRHAVTSQVAFPAGIPYLNFAFYEGSIWNRLFFHFGALPNQQMQLLITHMARQFGSKMFFAGHDYEWPRGCIDACKRTLLDLDGEVVGEHYYAFGAEDMESLVRAVQRSGANVLVPCFVHPAHNRLMEHLSSAGMLQRIKVAVCDLDEIMLSQLQPEMRAGQYCCNTYFMGVDTPQNRAFLERLVQEPGVDGLWPHGSGFCTNSGEGAYACVKAFATAADNAGSIAAEALIPWLERAQVESLQGLISMDPLTHHASINAFLGCSCGDGTIEILECIGTVAPQIPERYRELFPQPADSQRPPTPVIPSTPHERGNRQAAGVAGGNALPADILALTDSAILTVDQHGRILHANPSACQLFGYEPGELLHRHISLLIPPRFRAQHDVYMSRFLSSEISGLEQMSRAEIAGYRKNGSEFPARGTLNKLRTDAGWVVVTTIQDVSRQKEQQQSVLWSNTHDELTELPNRTLILQRIERALLRIPRSRRGVALLFIDIDDFRLVNDSYGHDYGDALLTEIARRFVDTLRPGDTVARIGADEFVVLCEDVLDALEVQAVVQRIEDGLKQPLEIGEKTFHVTASIGVAPVWETTVSAEELLRNADSALFSAKQKGRALWHVYDEGMRLEILERLDISNALRHAIEGDELRTCFQAIVDARDGQVVGAEILLRWFPESGEVSPSRFIPIAETTGSIVAIGYWVFEQACAVRAAWRSRAGDIAPYVSVNISARQLLEPELVERFCMILDETGADAGGMLLEITESVLMHDVNSSLVVLQRLADIGFSLAIDDFGTGHSSLGQLVNLPVDILKIDRVFVEHLESGKRSHNVAAAIISMARALDMDVIGEGVETARQSQILIELGCVHLQGYHFSKPVERADFEARFLDHT